MADLETRRSIYRTAFRCHFKHYGSTLSGKGPQRRAYTLIAIAVALLGVYNIWLNLNDGPSLNLIFSVVVTVVSPFAASRYGADWRHFSYLAHNFADLAASTLQSPSEVEALFKEHYPWLF